MRVTSMAEVEKPQALKTKWPLDRATARDHQVDGPCLSVMKGECFTGPRRSAAAPIVCEIGALSGSNRLDHFSSGFVEGAGGRERVARSRPPPDRDAPERAVSLLITDHGAERRDLQQRKSHVRSRTAAGGNHPLRT